MFDEIPVNVGLSRMRRIFFVRGARIDATEGPLELTFENGEVRLFGVGSNGETLVIDREPWADPFSGRVSAENEEFIVESGKWEAFDLGGLWSYGRFIGRCLTSVERTGDNS